MAWLRALALLHMVGALATNRLCLWLAATVEALRDSLVTEVVSGLLAEDA